MQFKQETSSKMFAESCKSGYEDKLDWQNWGASAKFARNKIEAIDICETDVELSFWQALSSKIAKRPEESV